MHRPVVAASVGAVLLASMGSWPAAHAAEPSAASSIVRAVAASSCPAPVKPTGSGTVTDPYLVLSLENLVWVNGQPSSWRSILEQRVDIDATGCTWTHGIGGPTNPFTGTYLGDGRSISNLTVDVASGPAGVFGVIRDATLQSITVTNATVTGTDGVGGLVGWMRGASAVKASSSSGQVSGKSAVGGLVGAARSGIVVNGYSTASVEASIGAAGGLVGDLSGVAVTRASYFVGTVGSAGNAGPIIGAGSTSAVRDTFWVDKPTSGTFQPGGLQRTTRQMRDFDTFSSAGWQIFDGWTPAVPWAICTGVKQGIPFHSKDFEASPCASLTPSTAIVLAQAGVPITPVAMSATKFTPTSYSVTSGSLPKGLTLDEQTGVISGTPAKKSPTRDIVITGSDGSREGRAALRVGVVRARPSATNRYSGCDTSTVGSVLRVTCSEAGTHAISPPAGSALVGIEALGADGRGYFGRGGAGASASLAGPVSASHANDGAFVVTVGSAGTLKIGDKANKGILDIVLALLWDTAYGGGYSSVQHANQDFAPQGLLAAAGGGGGGSQSWLMSYLSCMRSVYAKHPVAPGVTTYSAQEADTIGREVMSCTAAMTGSSANAGTAADTLPLSDNWADQAVGRQGMAGLIGLLAGSAGAAGKTYVPSTAAVATRPTAVSNNKARRGQVILTFDLSGAESVDVTTAPCSASTPALGELVTCAKPGQAQITVPDDAEVAVVAASGAGGGAGVAGDTLRDLAGGPGAKVTGIVDVSELNAVVAQVGGAGTSVIGAQHDVSALFYGEGGGYSGIGPTSAAQVLLAGGGGGGGDLSPADPPTAAEKLVMRAMAGKTAVRADSVPWDVPASSAGKGASGGVQGQSWQASGLVSEAAYDAVGGGGGSTRAALGTSYAQAAHNGLVTLRFCGLPGAPSVTSVAPGTSAGQATVDVVASAPTNTGGCDPTKYQFRTSGAMEWADAPALNFPIVYDLTSGQSVCVQMRALNAAGWSAPSSYACGTASDAAATALGAGGDIVIDADGIVSPTTLTSVGNGSTFTINNESSSLSILYADSATMTVGGNSCQNGCNVAAGTTATVTLVAGGTAHIYGAISHATTNISVN